MTAPQVADLHMHTKHSDGELTATALVELSAKQGLQVMALTDHDTLGGLEEAIDRGKSLGLEVIPGIELSVTFGTNDLHLLGYFVSASTELSRELERLQASRFTRARRICDKLEELGFPLDYDAVRARAKGGVLARPHIAEEMLAKGYVDSFNEAFNRFLGDGGPACFSKESLDVEVGVRLLRAVGGVPVLAHPQVSHCAEKLGDLRDLGVLGVEVWHPSHDSSLVASYLASAKSLGLVPTGGSDFHRRTPGGILPGYFGTPPENLLELRRLAG